MYTPGLSVLIQEVDFRKKIVRLSDVRLVVEEAES
jgi:hypothetical protein